MNWGILSIAKVCQSYQKNEESSKNKTKQKTLDETGELKHTIKPQFPVKGIANARRTHYSHPEDLTDSNLTYTKK